MQSKIHIDFFWYNIFAKQKALYSPKPRIISRAAYYIFFLRSNILDRPGIPGRQETIQNFVNKTSFENLNQKILQICNTFPVYTEISSLTRFFLLLKRWTICGLRNLHCKFRMFSRLKNRFLFVHSIDRRITHTSDFLSTANTSSSVR